MEELQAYVIVDKAVPFFFVLIAVEIVVARIAGRRLYRLSDSIADLSIGAVSEIAGLWTKVVFVVIYALLFQHVSLHALVGLPLVPDANPFGGGGIDWALLGWWSLVFVLIDHQYYWGHRFCHEVNAAWAAHVAHHSSEEFNLTVALRQSATQTLMTMWFYFPIALLGVTTVQFVVCFGINLIYQFWVHTRLIRRLGPLEWVMNTPSHHRVHHGRNPKYIDRNHAGVFIVWDRLYGTFIAEEEEPTYGVTSQLGSHNAIWSNVHHYAFVWRTFQKARGVRDKLRVIFGKTGWRPDYLGGPIVPGEVPPDYTKYDPDVPRPVAIYVFVHFIAATALMFAVAAQASSATGAERWLVIAGVILALASFSNTTSMLDARRWVVTAEIARLIAFIGFGLALVVASALAAPWGLAIAGFGAGSLAAWLLLVARRDRPGAAASAGRLVAERK